MAKEQPKWKPIKKGEKLPCWAFLMTMDGMITNVTAMGVTVAQDAYYLPSSSLLETIKDFPKEESEEKSAEKNSIDKVEPKFEIGDVMRTLEEAKEGITDGLPIVVSIDEEYYHCNNELISIKDQDKYEYPPINRKQKYANSIWHDMTEKPQGGENDRTLVVFEDGYSTTSNALLHIGFGYSKPYKWAYVNDILRLTLSENEQKPAEWSEEGEYCKHQLIVFCENCMVPDSNAKKCANWLKSLRPQNRWKPSEEHLQGMRRAICKADKGSDAERDLKDLYEQLKAL